MEEVIIKRSLLFKLLKGVLLALFLCFVISFTFSINDFRTLEDLSESERTEIMERDSFKYAVKLAREMENNEAKYGKLENAKSIELARCNCGSGKRIAKIYFRGEEEVFVDFTGEITTLTEKQYDDYVFPQSDPRHQCEKEYYGGVEISFLVEVVTSENYLDQLYECVKADLEKASTYKAAKKALLTHVGPFEVDDVAKVSCSDQGGMLKTVWVLIVMNNGDEICCNVSSAGVSYQYETAESFWSSVGAFGVREFTDIDFTVLIKDCLGEL